MGAARDHHCKERKHTLSEHAWIAGIAAKLLCILIVRKC